METLHPFKTNGFPGGPRVRNHYAFGIYGDKLTTQIQSGGKGLFAIAVETPSQEGLTLLNMERRLRRNGGTWRARSFPGGRSGQNRITFSQRGEERVHRREFPGRVIEEGRVPKAPGRLSHSRNQMGGNIRKMRRGTTKIYEFLRFS